MRVPPHAAPEGTLYLCNPMHAAPSLSTPHARPHPTRAHSSTTTRARKLIACCLPPHAAPEPSIYAIPCARCAQLVHTPRASTPHARTALHARKLIACCLPPHAAPEPSIYAIPCARRAQLVHTPRAHSSTRAQAYSLLSPPTRAPEPSIYAILSCPPARLRCEYTYDMSSFSRCTKPSHMLTATPDSELRTIPPSATPS
jgi:hypothetical protein